MKKLAVLTFAALLLGISPAMADNGRHNGHDNRGNWNNSHHGNWNNNHGNWNNHNNWHNNGPRHVVVRPAPRYYYQPVHYVYYPQPRPVYYYEQPRSNFILWNIFGR